MFMDLQKKNRFFLNALFWIFVLIAVPLLSETKCETDTTMGWVELHCRFNHLSVIIDGDSVGYTPLPLLNLEAGDHSIRISHPNQELWMSRDWEQVIHVDGGEKKVISVAFPRMVWIGSDPPGAAVYYQSRRIGITPMPVEIYPEVNGSILLKKMEYEDYRINQMELRSPLYHISMKRMNWEATWDRNRPRLKKNWVISSSIAALFSSAAGYYLQVKADRAYDKYMKNELLANPDRRNVSFNNDYTQMLRELR